MEPVFRAAIGISIAIHSAIIAPLLTVDRHRDPLRDKRELVIDYVAAKEAPAKTEPAPVEPQAPPKVEPAKKMDVAPAPPEKDEKATDEAKKAAQADAREQARIRSTKDYVNYYQLMRSRIHDRLRVHYRQYFEEGEVGLAFILRSDGSLESSAVDEMASTPDQTLQDIALRSLREASPFPPFPKALTLPRMTFTLQIDFKRE